MKVGAIVQSPLHTLGRNRKLMYSETPKSGAYYRAYKRRWLQKAQHQLLYKLHDKFAAL
jgi:hypothetical protein